MAGRGVSVTDVQCDISLTGSACTETMRICGHSDGLPFASAVTTFGLRGRGAYTPLVEIKRPSKRSLEQLDIHVIFIHGLAGDIEKTWTSGEE